MAQIHVSPRSVFVILLLATSATTLFAQNQAPQVVGPIDPVEVGEGEEFSVFLIEIFSDPDGDPMTFTVNNAANTSIATVSRTSTSFGDFITVDGIASGTTTASVTATDGMHTPTVHMFTINVVGNMPPVVDNPVGKVVLKPDAPELRIPFENIFSDPDGDDLEFTASSSNEAVAEITTGPGPFGVAPEVIITPVGLGTATGTITADDGNNP